MAELCDRKTLTGVDATQRHDVSRIGYCVCLLLDRLPYGDVPDESERAMIMEKHAVVVNNSDWTRLHAAT
jgi:hypothetical protein